MNNIENTLDDKIAEFKANIAIQQSELENQQEISRECGEKLFKEITQEVIRNYFWINTIEWRHYICERNIKFNITKNKGIRFSEMRIEEAENKLKEILNSIPYNVFENIFLKHDTFYIVENEIFRFKRAW
jgi:hypothetical protein